MDTNKSIKRLETAVAAGLRYGRIKKAEYKAAYNEIYRLLYEARMTEYHFAWPHPL